MRNFAAATVLAVLATGATTPVAADPYAITYTGTLTNSNSPDFINGQSYSVTFVFDNGSSTAASQTWTRANLTCTIWSFNTARNVTYSQNLVATPPLSVIGTATTNASGTLTANFSDISGNNFTSGFTYNGTAGAPFSWFANDFNDVFQHSSGGSVGDAAIGVQMAALNWSNPTPFTGSCFAPGPAITALTPTGGPSTGGTSVVITGTSFTGATAVTFGTTPATSFVVNSATQITAVAPAGAAASVVRVTVTTPNGASGDAAADDFTYAAMPPAPVPTMTEWAMILFGTILAGATALHLQRRRPMA